MGARGRRQRKVIICYSGRQLLSSNTFGVLHLGIATRSLPDMTIRVLMADDHPVVRTGIRAMIAHESDMSVVAEASDGAEVVALYGQHRPDVVLMDLRMPRQDGITSIRAIVADDPEARIVALTSYEGDADIYRALDAGACGYLIKDMLGAEVVGAIRSAAAGRRVIPPHVASRLAEFIPRIDLTPREQEVLGLAAKGLRNRDIARIIGRTEETVKVHLKHVMAKLGVGDRTEAVTLAMQRGIIHLDG
jgi:DNA-binding NarL/FixJ family response regulator